MSAMCSIVIIFLFHIISVHCVNILGVFSFPSISHQVVFQSLYRELSLRGHKVTAVTPDPLNDPSLTNLREISVRFTYEVLEKHKLQSIISKNANSFQSFSLIFLLTELIAAAELNSTQFQELIRDEQQEFDLILVECFHPVMYALAGRFKAPIICVSSLGVPALIHDLVSNPTHPLLFTDILLSYENKELSLWQNIKKVVFHIWSLYYHQYILVPRAQEMAVQYFGSDIPYVGDLQKDVSMLVINVNSLIYPPRPNVPAVVETGQMHMKSVKPLPKDLQQILDEAAEGVVYSSFGTNVKSVDISENLRETLTRAMSELPYKFIWKWDAEDLPGKPPNVVTKKWLPQQDLLAHPNVRAFITQGGLQSTDEAISSGVPLIGMPFFGDQVMNVQKIADSGIGLQLDPKTLTKEKLKMGITEVVENIIYKKRIKQVRDILFDKPMTGLETAVWWSEYVIRHKGATFLRNPTTNISWISYLMLDVLLSFVTGVTVIVYVTYKVTQFFVRGRTVKLKYS